MFEALAALGMFIAVPVTGRLAAGRLPSLVPTVARPAVWVAGGGVIWSVPLLASLVLGVYRPEVIGLAGWAVVAVIASTRVRRSVRWRPSLSRVGWPDRLVLLSVMLASALTLVFPSDPSTTGNDINVYAAHAVYMNNHGRLDVPYPWETGEPPPGYLASPGLYATQPTMTVQFAHLFPAWLAQTYAVFGFDGLIRLNAVVGILALLAIYGFARRLADARVAAFVVVFLAFNPAQVWVARQTLSEIFAQLLIWSGLLLLTIYLTRGGPRWGAWAGLVLGAAAFVRIDAFLLVPFLFIGHALWRVLQPRLARPAVSWGYFYATAGPTFALALAYYALFSQPYLIQHGSQILQIGALTVAALAALGATHLGRLLMLGRALFERRPVVLGLLGLLALVAAYAYLVRPNLPPFAVMDAPGAIYDGERSYVEEALVNIGRYLTPAAVLGAVAGWSAAFFAITDRRQRLLLALVPLLVVTLGYSAAYFWNQSAFPNHFWAIRRFVPVIIPAFIVFSALAATVGLRRLSLPGRRLAVGLSVPLLIFFTLWMGVPTYAVQERAGAVERLAELADHLPTEGEILALEGDYEAANFWLPLQLMFDRPIVPLRVQTDAGRMEALRRLLAASDDQPVMIVTAAHDYRMDAIVGNRTAQVTLARTLIRNNISPPPRTTLVEETTLTVIEATGLNILGVPFGAAPQWVAPVEGFHRAQLVDGRPLRWTDGHGRISIPLVGDVLPTLLAVSLADTGPGGGPLKIVVNGSTVYDGEVPAGPWAAEYKVDELVQLRLGEAAEIEIISDVFESEPVDRFSRETQFGVHLEKISFFADGR